MNTITTIFILFAVGVILALIGRCVWLDGYEDGWIAAYEDIQRTLEKELENEVDRLMAAEDKYEAMDCVSRAPMVDRRLP